jgi:CRISPR-associated protein Cas1
MGGQILDFSSKAAQLSVELGRLRVEIEGQVHHFLPDQLQSVVISAQGTTFTQAAAACLAKAGVAMVCCDEKHTPVGILQPLDQNTTTAERIALQAELSLPLKKRLWQQLIQAKLNAQGQVLRLAGKNDAGLLAMATEVRSGDPDNLEGQGARRYWQRLFEHGGFRRVPGGESPAPNSALNYGYAVLRSMTVRGICAAGLHPAFGLHHHNRYDSFRLASDLMEPYRPLIDLQVWRMGGAELKTLKPADKRKLIEALQGSVKTTKQRYQLPELVQRLCESLAQVILGNKRKLWIPGLLLDDGERQ